MTRGLSRRQFLKLTSAGTAALAFGWTAEACGDGEETPVPFFTADERATLDAALERMLPGASDAGAAQYIENLLSAFDHDPPLIFAGGPFSGRAPFPNGERGGPSDDSPRNDFERFLPLSRTKEIGWRVRLYGSATVQGGDFNDAVLGPTPGLRDVYREGLRALDAKSRDNFGATFTSLTAEQQDEAIAGTEAAFAGALIEHTLEAMYAAPEYGGNGGLAGWRWAQFQGDSQPLGYSIFDEAAGEYRELPDTPLSTQNPDDDLRSLGDEAFELLGVIVAGTGGKRFF
jgi:hypothetical protein